MKSRAWREGRALTLAKAMLLGYRIELEGKDWYHLQLPNGDWLMEDGLPKAFKGKLRAAQEALRLSGVYNGPTRGEKQT